jgi:hypothetical protein
MPLLHSQAHNIEEETELIHHILTKRRSNI